MTDQTSLSAALVAALADLAVIEKNQTADMGSFTSHYADLGSIVKKTRGPLAENGLLLVQSLEPYENGLAVRTILLHTSGESMEFGPLPFQQGNNAQATGSFITYMRRYALLAALGMATGEDDDGAAAVPRTDDGKFPTTPVPGYIRSVVDAREKLSGPERASLREWMTEEGLPSVPSQLTEAEADRVVDYIVHGLPAVES